MNKLDYTFIMCMGCNRAMVIKNNQTLEDCVACGSPRIGTFDHANIADEDMVEWAKCIVKEDKNV